MTSSELAPSWSWEAIFFIVPVAIAPAIEHFGDVLAIGSVTGKNYVRDPGIHRTLLGDGLATMLASMFGGPPNTTYSENTGVLAVRLSRKALRVLRPASPSSPCCSGIGSSSGARCPIP